MLQEWQQTEEMLARNICRNYGGIATEHYRERGWVSKWNGPLWTLSNTYALENEEVKKQKNFQNVLKKHDDFSSLSLEENQMTMLEEFVVCDGKWDLWDNATGSAQMTIVHFDAPSRVSTKLKFHLYTMQCQWNVTKESDVKDN